MSPLGPTCCKQETVCSAGIVNISDLQTSIPVYAIADDSPIGGETGLVAEGGWGDTALVFSCVYCV